MEPEMCENENDKLVWTTPEVRSIEISETATGDFGNGEAAFGPAFAS